MRARALRALASLAIAACALAALPSGAADVVEIPVLLPLTGPASFLGRGTQQGIQAVEDYANRTGGINGKPLHFAFQDDQSNPQVAVELLNHVLEKHPPIVLGSTIVANCRAMASFVKTSTVMYCYSPGLHPEENSYVFSANVSTADSIAAGLDYFAKLGLTKLGVITATDSTGQDADKAIDDAVAASRGTLSIVGREHFNPTDVTVSAQMSRIKAANPQVLVAWVTGTPVATVFRAIKDLDVDVPVYTSNGNSINAFLKQWASVLPKTLLLPASSNVTPQLVTDAPGKAALATYFDQLKRNNIAPDIMNGTGYDPTMIVVEALRKLRPDPSAADVRAAITGLRGWTGILGKYDFRAVPQRGLDRSAVYIARWNPENQSWVPVSRGGGVPLRNDRGS